MTEQKVSKRLNVVAGLGIGWIITFIYFVIFPFIVDTSNYRDSLDSWHVLYIVGGSIFFFENVVISLVNAICLIWKKARVIVGVLCVLLLLQWLLVLFFSCRQMFLLISPNTAINFPLMLFLQLIFGFLAANIMVLFSRSNRHYFQK